MTSDAFSSRGCCCWYPLPNSQEPGSNSCPATHTGSREWAKHLNSFAGSHQVCSLGLCGGSWEPPCPGAGDAGASQVPDAFAVSAACRYPRLGNKSKCHQASSPRMAGTCQSCSSNDLVTTTVTFWNSEACFCKTTLSVYFKSVTNALQQALLASCILLISEDSPPPFLKPHNAHTGWISLFCCSWAGSAALPLLPALVLTLPASAAGQTQTAQTQPLFTGRLKSCQRWTEDLKEPFCTWNRSLVRPSATDPNGLR